MTVSCNDQCQSQSCIWKICLYDFNTLDFIHLYPPKGRYNRLRHCLTKMLYFIYFLPFMVNKDYQNLSYILTIENCLDVQIIDRCIDAISISEERRCNNVTMHTIPYNSIKFLYNFFFTFWARQHIFMTRHREIENAFTFYKYATSAKPHLGNTFSQGMLCSVRQSPCLQPVERSFD